MADDRRRKLGEGEVDPAKTRLYFSPEPSSTARARDSKQPPPLPGRGGSAGRAGEGAHDTRIAARSALGPTDERPTAFDPRATVVAQLPVLEKKPRASGTRVHTTASAQGTRDTPSPQLSAAGRPLEHISPAARLEWQSKTRVLPIELLVPGGLKLRQDPAKDHTQRIQRPAFTRKPGLVSKQRVFSWAACIVLWVSVAAASGMPSTAPHPGVAPDTGSAVTIHTTVPAEEVGATLEAPRTAADAARGTGRQPLASAAAQGERLGAAQARDAAARGANGVVPQPAAAAASLARAEGEARFVAGGQQLTAAGGTHGERLGAAQARDAAARGANGVVPQPASAPASAARAEREARFAAGGQPPATAGGAHGERLGAAQALDAVAARGANGVVPQPAAAASAARAEGEARGGGDLQLVAAGEGRGERLAVPQARELASAGVANGGAAPSAPAAARGVIGGPQPTAAASAARAEGESRFMPAGLPPPAAAPRVSAGSAPTARTAAAAARGAAGSALPKVAPRDAVEALAAGDTLAASHLYAALSKQNPDNAAYARAARILMQRLQTQAQGAP